MASIGVVFKVPPKILKGLANGTLERVGGVIRRTGDKKVVAWLKESTSESGSLPNILSSPQMLMGMQVANLAVSVAGFTLIYHKLQKVERQIQGLDQKLGHLADDHQFLDQKHLIGQLSPMVASLQTLAGVHRINDRLIVKDKLVSADDRLGEASVYFKEILGRMLAKKLEQERPDEFAACYRAWVMASQGHIQTMAELGEIPEALARAENLQLEHQSFGRDYLAVRRDPLRKLLSERAQDHAEPLLMELGQQCAGAHDLIMGKVLQLDHMKGRNFRLEDLPEENGPGNQGYALLHFD